MAEMRIQEHMKIRKKREEQLELEKRLAREQKERDHDRLLKQQQKVIDTKNEKFEIMVRREQERKEREYRQKEKDAVIKKIELQRTILDARRVQQDELVRIGKITIFLVPFLTLLSFSRNVLRSNWNKKRWPSTKRTWSGTRKRWHRKSKSKLGGLSNEKSIVIKSWTKSSTEKRCEMIKDRRRRLN